jgi:hypothetical protein
MITPARLEKARRIGQPDSVARLASFVDAESDDTEEVFYACLKHCMEARMPYEESD